MLILTINIPFWQFQIRESYSPKEIEGNESGNLDYPYLSAPSVSDLGQNCFYDYLKLAKKPIIISDCYG